MKFLRFLLIGYCVCSQSELSKLDRNGDGSGWTESNVDFTECNGESCDLSVKFPTLAIRLPGTRLVEKELATLRKKFELFRKGAAEEQQQWKNETKSLRIKIDQLERAINLNIEKTENVNDQVRDDIKLNLKGIVINLYICMYVCTIT